MKHNTALIPSLREEFLSPFSDFFDDIMLKEFPNASSFLGANPFGTSARPKVDVTEYDDKILIEAEVGGLNKDNISVVVKNGCLTISGEKSESREKSDKEKGTLIIKELSRAKFSRSFNLGSELDENSVNAKFDDGFLTIEIKKKKEAVKPVIERKIQIQ